MVAAEVTPRMIAVRDHPLHRQLGLQHLDYHDGRARLTMTVGATSLNPAGMLYGGVIYLLADVCAYASVLSRLDTDTEAVTHDIHVSMLRSAGANDVLVFDAEVIKLGRKLVFVDVRVHRADWLIATARVTKSLLAA